MHSYSKFHYLKKIESIVENYEKWVVQLYGYVSGVPILEADDHWVVILDYIKEEDTGWFLILDSDAPYAPNGINQGQGVWVREDVIKRTFYRGKILSDDFN